MPDEEVVDMGLFNKKRGIKKEIIRELESLGGPIKKDLIQLLVALKTNSSINYAEVADNLAVIALLYQADKSTSNKLLQIVKNLRMLE